MKYTIRDLRNNPDLVKNRDAEELVDKLASFAFFSSYSLSKVGIVVKKLIETGIDFSDITSEQTKNRRIK